MNTVKEFKQFLRDEGVAAQFYNNTRLLKHAIEYYMIIDPMPVDKYIRHQTDVNDAQLISVAFLWSKSLEGFEFWAELDYKWQKKLSNLKISDMCKNGCERVKIFYFEGFGNYSQSFGWDDGLNIGISTEMSFDEAYDLEDNERENTGSDWLRPGLPETVRKGVFPYFENSNGGTRNVRGFVIASDKKEAQEMAEKWADEHYEVIEYQED